MEGERFSGVLLPKALIDALFLPEGLQLRLSLGGIGPHAKACLEQVQGLLVGGLVRAGRLLLLRLALLRPAVLRHGGAAAAGIISPGRCRLEEREKVPLLRRVDQALVVVAPQSRWVGLKVVWLRARGGPSACLFPCLACEVRRIPWS